MHHSFIRRNFSLPCKAGVMILFSLWVIGFVSGFLLPDLPDEQVMILPRDCFAQPVSLVGFISLWLIPLAVFRFCLSCGYFVPIYILSFLRAFIFGVCLRGVCAVFGSGTWLVIPLLFFSTLFSNLFYLVLSFSFFTMDDASVKRIFVLTVFLSVLIGLIDFCFISPFCSGIF